LICKGMIFTAFFTDFLPQRREVFFAMFRKVFFDIHEVKYSLFALFAVKNINIAKYEKYLTKIYIFAYNFYPLNFNVNKW